MVGLGNPGRRYSRTRHNAGFLFVRALAKDWKVRLKKRRHFSKTCVIERDKGRVLLAIPQTYMNRSGLAVRSIVEGGVKPDRLVVVYDDLDIPLGEIKIRKEGGPGSHRGVSSIIDEIQTEKFPRIRIGIGPLNPEEDAVDFVLSPFRQEEKPQLEQSLKLAREALDLILSGEIERAMTMYNRRREQTPGSVEADLG